MSRQLFKKSIHPNRSQLLILLLTLLLGSMVLNNAYAKSGMIGVVNVKVSKIIKMIKRGDLSSIKIEHSVVSEVSPPAITFYYTASKKSARLRAVIIVAGHETWGNEFAYYFDQAGKLLKYSKKTIGRPDHPPKQAIIYHQGKVIWSNISNPKVSPKKLYQLFNDTMKTSIIFSGY